jgi:plasmid segregation protein ParM
MNVGIDLGYSATKAIAGVDRTTLIPSVVGTPDRARFSLNGTGIDLVIELPGDGTWLVGEGAITQSRFLDRREDRAWIESPSYRRLMLAAFTELTMATRVNLTVVTGLPVAFYSRDKHTLRDLFLGEHRVGREGCRAQSFRVRECRVIPQPFGALLAEALDNNGVVVNAKLATGAVGVIDVGGKTTNLLSVNRLAEIGKETASVNVGAWDAMRAVREHLAELCPNLEIRDHQVIDAVIAREVYYYGKPVDLEPVVDRILEPMAQAVIAQATQLWNGAAGLDTILVAGGGAHLLGSRISRHFQHARTVDDPVFANARGYWRLAQRIGNTQS